MQLPLGNKQEAPLRFWGWFFFCLFCFLLLRLAAVLTGLERVSHPNELGIGTFAKGWLEGLKLPLWQYQVDTCSGESVVISRAAAFFMEGSGAGLKV